MRTALLALLTCLLLAPAAQAAVSPITIGTGRAPEVAVESDGTAYVVWNVAAGPNLTDVHFCKVPRGATACATTATLHSQLGASARPYVFVTAPGQLTVLTQVCCNEH